MITAAELAQVELLSGMTAERLEQLAADGHELLLAPGDTLFCQGDEPTHFWLLLDGTLESTHRVGAEERSMMKHEPGGYVGGTALLTRTRYRATTWALTESRLLELDADTFRGIALDQPEILQKLLGVVAPVFENVGQLDADAQKLLALGSLAAGLAHELNNPAGAALRATSAIRDADTRAQAALSGLAAQGMSAEAVGRLCGFTGEAVALATRAEPLDPLERSDRELELSDWLEGQGVECAPDLASTLVEGGLDREWIGRVLSEVDPPDPGEALAWIGSRVTAARVGRELEDATTRIAELVDAVRNYSYLDQASHQEIDVHKGLETTLTVLAHKVRDRRVELVRDYDRTLPDIHAHAAELNQVWTNLIDNAIAAVDEGGRVTIRTSREDAFVRVDVEDNGPGVPEEIAGRIFDAFYTTKSPGEGTGLGLDIARRIVARHDGRIRLREDGPGACFQVLLPVEARTTTSPEQDPGPAADAV